MKRISLLLVLILTFTLSACGAPWIMGPAESDQKIEYPSSAVDSPAKSETSMQLAGTTYLELLTAYTTALNEKWDVDTLMEKGYIMFCLK